MSLFYTTGSMGEDRKRIWHWPKVNSPWGVCGITSAVLAMYAKRPAERARLINATSYRTVLAAIKNFLTELRAGGETQLLREIVSFNSRPLKP